MTDNLFFIDEDEVLAHHGVKGMKWGVRKQRAASGGAGSTKKRKGLSRKQKAAIAGVLGTAAAAGAGYYLHKSGKGKKLAALAKRGGASAKSYAQGKGRNLGAQARVKRAQAKRQARAFGKDAKNFAGAQAALGKLTVANAKRGAKSAAGSVKSKFGKKAPGKAVGFKRVVGQGTKVVRPKGANADKLAKIAAAGIGLQVGAAAAGVAAGRKVNNRMKGGRSRKRRR